MAEPLEVLRRARAMGGIATRVPVGSLWLMNNSQDRAPGPRGRARSMEKVPTLPCADCNNSGQVGVFAE